MEAIVRAGLRSKSRLPFPRVLPSPPKQRRMGGRAVGLLFYEDLRTRRRGHLSIASTGAGVVPPNARGLARRRAEIARPSRPRIRCFASRRRRHKIDPNATGSPNNARRGQEAGGTLVSVCACFRAWTAAFLPPMQVRACHGENAAVPCCPCRRGKLPTGADAAEAVMGAGFASSNCWV